MWAYHGTPYYARVGRSCPDLGALKQLVYTDQGRLHVIV